MTTTRSVPAAVSAETPAVPLTIEGFSTLHQMLRLRWSAWRALTPQDRKQIAGEAADVLGKMESNQSGQSAFFSLIGHKADLMFLHFRNSFAELNAAELELAQLRLNDLLEPTTSYLSVIELGLYESTTKTYRTLVERGIEPHSEEWKREIEETLSRQREAMRPRLFPSIPNTRYVCFYPMLRTHGELGYKQEQRFHLELGLLKMAHAQRLLPIEQLLSDASIPMPLPAASARGQVRPAVVPESRGGSVSAARQSNVSPFAADSARKSVPKAESVNPSDTPEPLRAVTAGGGGSAVIMSRGPPAP